MQTQWSMNGFVCESQYVDLSLELIGSQWSDCRVRVKCMLLIIKKLWHITGTMEHNWGRQRAQRQGPGAAEQGTSSNGKPGAFQGQGKAGRGLNRGAEATTGARPSEDVGSKMHTPGTAPSLTGERQVASPSERAFFT